MLKSRVVGVALVFALVGPPVAEAPGDAGGADCALVQFASLDLVRTSDGSFLVPVTIQGKDALLTLDTASAFSVVSTSAKRRLGLSVSNVSPASDVEIGHRRIEHIAHAQALSIGNVVLKSVEFLEAPDNIFSNPPGDPTVDGSLGMDLLRTFDVELDLARDKLKLYSSKHCPGRVVYWSKDYASVPIRFGEFGEFYFPMELDGKKIEATIDSDSATASLSVDVTRRLYDFDAQSPGVEREVNEAGQERAYYRAMDITNGGLKIINARVKLRPSHSDCWVASREGAADYGSCPGIHPLRVGRSTLVQLRIYVATKEGVLYFTRADAGT